jgi:predicted nucleotidyltransferase
MWHREIGKLLQDKRLDQIALWQDLEDLLVREVDIVTESALHHAIREQVLREAVPL